MISHKIFLSAAIVWLALCSTTRETLARLGAVEHRHLSGATITFVNHEIDALTTSLGNAIEDIVELNAAGSAIDIEETLSGKLDRVSSLKTELEAYSKNEFKKISDEGAALVAKAVAKAAGEDAAQTPQEKIEDLTSKRNNLDSSIFILDGLINEIDDLADSSVVIIERLREQAETVDNALETATVAQLEDALLSVQGLLDYGIAGAQQRLNDAEKIISRFAQDRAELVAKSIAVEAKLYAIDPNA